MRIRLSNEYLNARFHYCNKKLESMPIVSEGVHNGIQVLRIRHRLANGKYKTKEIRLTSKKASALNWIDRLRKTLIEEIDALKHTQGVDPLVSSSMKISGISKMNGEFYRSLVAESNTMPIKGDYYHKGIHMRSRLEVLVAEILDEISLQYKYEAGILIDDTLYCPDFTVYLEAIDCCFFIEVIGMADSADYWYKNASKYADYARSGMLINGELLLIVGTESHIPETDAIYNSIVNMVNLLVWRAIK